MSIIISTELKDLLIKSSPISGRVRMTECDDIEFELETVDDLDHLSEEVKRKTLFEGDFPRAYY